MRFTDNYSLPCLDEGDYAAVALYLQRLAHETENVLVAQKSEAENFNRQPTDIFTLHSNTFDIGAGSITEFVFNSNNSFIFQNYDPVRQGSSNAPFGGETNSFPMPGLYHMGFNFNIQAVGSLTAGSFRQVRMVLSRHTGSGIVEVTDYSRRTLEESATGGNFIGTSGIVSIGSDYQSYSIFTEFSHGNSASNMFIAAGSVAWRTRIGSIGVIEVT